MKYLDKNKIEKFFLSPNSKIKDAIKSLSESTLQIVLVVNKDNKLIGTITDGDIRRGFLSGLRINQSIKKVINTRPIVSYNNQTRELIQYTMQNNVVLQLPVVSRSNRITGIYITQEYTKDNKIKNPILILAGGRGRRMMPYTKRIPKPMLSLNGKPILEHILIGLKNQGFYNVFISTHYKSEVIEKYFKNGNKYGLKIKYIKEKKPLGTAGCLHEFSYYLKSNENFFIVNGDVLSNLDFNQMLQYHKKNNADATMGSINFEMKNPYGVIKTKENKIIGFREKPVSQTYINAGIYILNSKLTNFLKKNKKKHITDLFKIFIKKKFKVFIYPIYEFWNEIGDKDKYEKLINR